MIMLTKEQSIQIADKALELGLSKDEAIYAGWLAKITGDIEFGIKYLERQKKDE